MAMSIDAAGKIVTMRRKLYDLRAEAPPDQVAAIDVQIARLAPYKSEANRVVMAASDAEFNAAAASLTAQTKNIDAAISDITKIAKALTQAATVITTILQLVQVVGGVP